METNVLLLAHKNTIQIRLKFVKSAVLDAGIVRARLTVQSATVHISISAILVCFSVQVVMLKRPRQLPWLLERHQIHSKLVSSVILHV